MDREKMIEEMAKTLRNKRVEQGFTNFKCEIHCNNCPSKQYHCVENEYAKILFDKGYRKIPDGAVVMTAEERDEEMREYNEERKAFEEIIDELRGENTSLQNQLNARCDFCKNTVRKETAKEILQTFYIWLWEDYKLGTHILRPEEIEKLCKKYGVEVEE